MVETSSSGTLLLRLGQRKSTAKFCSVEMARKRVRKEGLKEGRGQRLRTFLPFQILNLKGKLKSSLEERNYYFDICVAGAGTKMGKGRQAGGEEKVTMS